MDCWYARSLTHRFPSSSSFDFVNCKKRKKLPKKYRPNHNLFIADCLSFSNKLKTLRIRDSYNSRRQPKTSSHEVKATRRVERGSIEVNEKISVSFSPDLVAERIKASRESLHALIFTVIDMMDRLIQSISSEETTTVSSRETRHQYKLPYSGVPLSYRFPTKAHLPQRDIRPIMNYWNQRWSVEYTCWLKKPVASMHASKVFDESIKILTICWAKFVRASAQNNKRQKILFWRKLTFLYITDWPIRQNELSIRLREPIYKNPTRNNLSTHTRGCFVCFGDAMEMRTVG